MEEHQSEGQSAETKAWLARRAEADRAIAASEARRDKERAAEEQHVIRQRAGANPMVLILAFLLVFGLLALFLWYFIQRVTCDPMFSSRGNSQECTRAAR